MNKKLLEEILSEDQDRVTEAIDTESVRAHEQLEKQSKTVEKIDKENVFIKQQIDKLFELWIDAVIEAKQYDVDIDRMNDRMYDATRKIVKEISARDEDEYI